MKRLILFAPLALAACNQPAPELILPPADLAECADEPAPPDLIEWAWAEKIKAASQAPTPAAAAAAAIELARFTALSRDKKMLDAYLLLREAFGSCKSKVDGLKAWRNEAAG